MVDTDQDQAVIRAIRKNMFHLVTEKEPKINMPIDDYPTFWENELFSRLIPPIEKEIAMLELNLSRLRQNSNYRAGIAHMIYMNKKVLEAINGCKSPSQRDDR